MSAFLVQLCSPMLHNSSVSALKILHFCFHNPNLRNREWSNRYLQDQKFATSCDVTEWITTMLQPNTEIKRAASPIIHSARKCSSRFIWSAYVLSNLFSSKPSIVFSPQKPFYSQSNYSFWWLGIFFLALISSNFPDVNKTKGVSETALQLNLKFLFTHIGKTHPSKMLLPSVFMCTVSIPRSDVILLLSSSGSLQIHSPSLRMLWENTHSKGMVWFIMHMK